MRLRISQATSLILTFLLSFSTVVAQEIPLRHIHCGTLWGLSCGGTWADTVVNDSLSSISSSTCTVLDGTQLDTFFSKPKTVVPGNSGLLSWWGNRLPYRTNGDNFVFHCGKFQYKKIRSTSRLLTCADVNALGLIAPRTGDTEDVNFVSGIFKGQTRNQLIGALPAGTFISEECSFPYLDGGQRLIGQTNYAILCSKSAFSSLAVGLDVTSRSPTITASGFDPAADPLNVLQKLHFTIKVKKCVGSTEPPTTTIKISIKKTNDEVIAENLQVPASFANSDRYVANGVHLPTLLTTSQFQTFIRYARTNPVKFVVKSDSHLGEVTREIKLSTCGHLFGNGGQHFTFGYGNSSNMNATQVVDLARQHSDFLLTANPFKEHKAKFSFYVDLAPYDDANWNISDFAANTSCRASSTYTLIQGRGPEASSVKGAGLISLNPSSVPGSTPRWKSEKFVHEVGHAYCGLDEEYFDNTNVIASPDYDQPNCTTKPARRFKDLYGQYHGDASTFRRCSSNSDAVRPSDSSVMSVEHSANLPAFNTVSCGQCMARILGQVPARRHFPACAAMQGVTAYATGGNS